MTSLSTRRRRISLAVALSAAGALAAAPAAFGADAVLERSGQTQLTLDRATAKVLTANGVSVAPIRPAGVKGGSIAFPVTGGVVDDLSTGAGRITHSGGLRFQAGRTVVRVTDFNVVVGKRSFLTAKLGAKRIPLLNLNTSKAKVAIAAGRDITIGGVTTTLTPQAATALNRAFKVKLFSRKVSVGAVKVTARSYSTAVTLDAALASTLTAVGITPGVIGPGGADAAGRLVFPVSGGTLAKANLAGQVTHVGGISLTKGATKVELTDFTIDTTKAQPELTALVGGNRVAILTIGLGTATTGTTHGLATVNGATLTFTPAAAALLNSTFGLGSALTGTTAFGTAGVRAPLG